MKATGLDQNTVRDIKGVRHNASEYCISDTGLKHDEPHFTLRDFCTNAGYPQETSQILKYKYLQTGRFGQSD